jgi:hypothetical protein
MKKIRAGVQRNKTRNQKSIYPRLPTSLIVGLGFFMFMLMLIVLFYFFDNRDTPQQKCEMECAEKNMLGKLEYVYQREVTAGMRSRGPIKCKCYEKL